MASNDARDPTEPPDLDRWLAGLAGRDPEAARELQDLREVIQEHGERAGEALLGSLAGVEAEQDALRKLLSRVQKAQAAALRKPPMAARPDNKRSGGLWGLANALPGFRWVAGGLFVLLIAGLLHQQLTTTQPFPVAGTEAPAWRGAAEPLLWPRSVTKTELEQLAWALYDLGAKPALYGEETRWTLEFEIDAANQAAVHRWLADKGLTPLPGTGVKRIQFQRTSDR